MPAAKLKPLHLGSNLSDLKPKFEINIKGKNTKMLCTTAQKLYEKAVKEGLDGDQEQSYVDFMKYLEVVTFVQNTEDYNKDGAFYASMLGKSNIRAALDQAEGLQRSLQHRYQLISEKEEIDAALLQQEEKEAEEEERRRAEKARIAPGQGEGEIADVSEVSLSSSRLFTLLKDKRMQMLILDARAGACFADSHMTVGNLISVPQEIIKAGMSAAALEKLLPEESKKLFGQRKEMNLVILLDWTTTASTLTPGSNLYTLKHILQLWDPNVIYKYPPLILDGGYDDWLQRYPMLTTNPRAQVPRGDDSSLEDFLLDDIEYPPLSTSPPRPTDPLRPGVNRGSKAAAIQTYEERELLEAREKGVEQALGLEKDRLDKEKEWELLRVRREMEAEGEMRLQLQGREEQLVRDISRLERAQQHKEAENQSLRKQLEEYRKREAAPGAVQPPPEDEAAISSRIRDKEAEARNVANQREEIARERLKKVAEDRKKRKAEEERMKQQQRGEKASQEGENGISLAALDGELASSASMKRSHSTPNIAQPPDDEYCNESVPPQFDRAAKPQPPPPARRRDFMGVIGRPPAAGLVGLKNLGNTCYMNSVMQCISNTKELCAYFMSGEYHRDVNRRNKTRGEIVEEVAAAVRAIWSGDFRSIALRDLKHAVGQYKEVFRGSQQQDSHEFLFFLINWLHDDLNKRSSKSQLESRKNLEGLSDADKQWREFEGCNESLIRTLFYGQQKSTLHCLTCNKESSTYGEFNHLSLPLPDHSNRTSVTECIRLYLNGDRVSGWNCPACKQPRDAVMKFDIIRLPHILVIHLKRFYHDGWSRKKENMVDFPLSDLDIQHGRTTRYHLCGVSNHYGTMEGGHYTAYCRNAVLGRWFKFDDSEVSGLDSGKVKSPAAYILFYSSVNYSVAKLANR